MALSTYGVINPNECMGEKLGDEKRDLGEPRKWGLKNRQAFGFKNL
jgi:hypothetical protein